MSAGRTQTQKTRGGRPATSPAARRPHTRRALTLASLTLPGRGKACDERVALTSPSPPPTPQFCQRQCVRWPGSVAAAGGRGGWAGEMKRTLALRDAAETSVTMLA